MKVTITTIASLIFFATCSFSASSAEQSLALECRVDLGLSKPSISTYIISIDRKEITSEGGQLFTLSGVKTERVTYKITRFDEQVIEWGIFNLDGTVFFISKLNRLNGQYTIDDPDAPPDYGSCKKIESSLF